MRLASSRGRLRAEASLDPGLNPALGANSEMPPPASYSKWDNLVDSDSEAEDAAPNVASEEQIAMLKRMMGGA